MLSVKALAESDAKQEPPVLFGPRDPCEEYAHLDQTSQCMAYARGRGTKWRDEFKACHTCVFWRLAAMRDDLAFTFRDRSRSCDAAGDKTSLPCTCRNGLFGLLLKDWLMLFGVLIMAIAAFLFHRVRKVPTT